MKPPVEKPVVLYKGLGNWHHPIATKNAEAQKFFDQGLALLYGFNRYEALRSFRKAAELDASAAMPWWGMAMATGPYVNMGTEGDGDLDSKAACKAVEAGLKIAGAPARERAYLEAAATRCPEYKPEAYARAMKRLAERYPDDLDAATLYAESLMVPVRWHWYGSDGKPAAGVAEAEQTLEQVLRRWPEHPGANHYYIHAVESSPTPERAVPSAQRLMGVVPSAGHMVHMPAHIWLVLGDYELAATVNQRASQVDREYFAAIERDGRVQHVLRPQSALRGLCALHAGAAGGDGPGGERDVGGDPAGGRCDAGDGGRVSGGGGAHPGAGTGVGRNTEDAATGGEVSRADGDLALCAGDGTAGAGRPCGGRARARAFEAARKKIPADRPWGMNASGDVMALAAEIVGCTIFRDAGGGGVALGEGGGTAGRAGYDEPPAWYYPVRESLGAALVRAGRAGKRRRSFARA